MCHDHCLSWSGALRLIWCWFNPNPTGKVSQDRVSLSCTWCQRRPRVRRVDQGVDQAPINPVSLLRTDLFWETEQHLKLMLPTWKNRVLFVLNLVFCKNFQVSITVTGTYLKIKASVRLSCLILHTGFPKTRHFIPYHLVFTQHTALSTNARKVLSVIHI